MLDHTTCITLERDGDELELEITDSVFPQCTGGTYDVHSILTLAVANDTCENRGECLHGINQELANLRASLLSCLNGNKNNCDIDLTLPAGCRGNRIYTRYRYTCSG